MATETLSPTPIQRFVDNNGNALANGQLFTYAAGTTTKLGAYLDSVGTVATNPIRLNARGETPLWIPPNIAYKFVLAPSTDTDPPSAPIWTVDNIVNSQLLTLYGGVDVGVVNAYVLNFSANFTSYTDGIGIYWIPSHNNTGPSTINVNGLGVVNIVNQDLSALAANQLVANQIAFILCKGGQFLLSSIVGSGGILTVAGVNVTGSTIPANGLYLPAGNTVALARNTVDVFQVDPSGQGSIFEPGYTVSALRNVATSDSGSFVGTLTGCTTSPTATFNWVRNGTMVTIDCNAGLSGTSNATTLSVTGAPAFLTPSRGQSAMCIVRDNGSQYPGIANVFGGTITYALYSPALANFTAAGSKGIPANQTFTYSLT